MVADLLDDDALLDLRPRTRMRRAAENSETAEAQALATTHAPSTAAPASRVEGLCALCGAKPARTACRACGRGACTADTWALLGVCRDCARGRA